jgi:8-oxo-dGTP diphosphatase
MKHLQVVAAIIVDADKILCVQRPQHKFEYLSYKYEFPGGKIEVDEKKEEALIREIKEELNLDITVNYELTEVYYEYPDFVITMFGFICNSASYQIELREHLAYKWLKKSELKDLDWAAADIPIVDKLILTSL